MAMVRASDAKELDSSREMAMVRTSDAKEVEVSRDLSMATRMTTHISKTGDSLSLEMETDSSLRVEPTYNFDKCNIGMIVINEVPSLNDIEKIRRLHQVPLLTDQYVDRSAEQQEIEEWLVRSIDDQKPSLLRLYGGAYTGKTSLAIWAAIKALALTNGFSEVAWVGSEMCKYEEAALDKMCEDMSEVFPLLKAGNRSLLVLDDVTNDRIIYKLREVKFVLITTRHKEIAEFSRYSDNLHQVSVGGLSPGETEELIFTIVKEEIYDELRKENRMSKVHQICRLFGNLPWPVRAMAGRLKMDYKFWKRNKFNKYAKELGDEIKKDEDELMCIAADSYN